MCQIVSVGVHPTTYEVFHIPGMWHHSDIAKHVGISPDQMFDPEIHLDTKKIDFPGTSLRVAFGARSLPDDLVNKILSELKLESETEININDVYRWNRHHEMAVHKWIATNIPSYKNLIAFSEHTWMPEHYVDTILPGFVNTMLKDGLPEDDRENALIRRAWQIEFENTDKRVRVWR